MTTSFRLMRAVLRPTELPPLAPAPTCGAAPDDILARFDALLGYDATAERENLRCDQPDQSVPGHRLTAVIRTAGASCRSDATTARTPA